jgi:integrase
MPNRNRGHIVDQKPPLKPREVWSIRTRLQVSGAERDLALFNLAIDSKLRGCDLVTITVSDIALSGVVRDRAVIVQRKTGRPVQFEITEQTRAAVGAWISRRGLTESDYLFPSRIRAKPHMSTRQYGRIVDKWVSCIGLDPKRYGTHSMRRTKASQIYKKTGNIRAVQLLLGHAKLESTVRYLGIEVDDALVISKQVEL